jgi:hypothetical protein
MLKLCPAVAAIFDFLLTKKTYFVKNHPRNIANDLEISIESI